jgi:nucleotide-binding universal stress UspA family protein
VGTVIVATDGSELANKAAATGLSMLKPVDHVVVATAVHLHDPDLTLDATGHAGATLTPEELETQHEAATVEGQAVVDSLAAALRANGSLPSATECLVVGGDPGRALCQLAEDRRRRRSSSAPAGEGGSSEHCSGRHRTMCCDTLPVPSS